MAEKGRRQIEVYNIVQNLKRATPEQVLTQASRVLGKDPKDPAFRRSIYRDLKSLVSNHQLGSKYYTAQGEEIEPGEEANYQNFRLEYFVLGHENTISGLSVLKNVGGDVFGSDEICNELKIAEGVIETPQNHCSLLIDLGLQRMISVYFPSNIRPVKFLVGRMPNAIEDYPDFEGLKEAFGARAVVLLLPIRSLSRYKSLEVPAHALLEFPKEDFGVHITDFESSVGSSFTLEAEKFEEVYQKLASSELTVDSEYEDVNWVDISSNTAAHIEIPGLLRLGKAIFRIRKN